jgi:hypothetical protein
MESSICCPRDSSETWGEGPSRPLRRLLPPELTTNSDPNDIRREAVSPDTPIGRFPGQRHYRTDWSCLTRRGWRPNAARAHAVVVAVLNPTETLIAARRLADARPHLAAIAGIVHHEDLWRLWRDELTGVDISIDGWDIRGRWFGVVVVATPRLGVLPRGETIPWRVIAAQIAASERRSSS